MAKKVRTSFELEADHMDALKAIAGDLGFYQTRGAGAGELPNISAFLRALATADHRHVVAALGALGIEQKEAAA